MEVEYTEGLCGHYCRVGTTCSRRVKNQNSIHYNQRQVSPATRGRLWVLYLAFLFLGFLLLFLLVLFVLCLHSLEEELGVDGGPLKEVEETTVALLLNHVLQVLHLWRVGGEWVEGEVP